ncbi:MAG: NB-ARC domain-containing protein [Xenococcaceae cyanobacterium MO_188.B32]|nr:NB-ARC domain-containing protein [Xenococcaceae cyanobacterium MO_188.B32]
MKLTSTQSIRGKVFSAVGWKKLQFKKRDWENKNNFGNRCTIEKLSELTGLAKNTVIKIIKRNKGVDKRSLVQFSMAFDFELSSDDYTSPNSLNNPNDNCAFENPNWEKQAPKTSLFHGRTSELDLLEKWLMDDQCRLITLQGVVGIGKTALCVELIKQTEQKFEHIIWRSLKNPPSLEKFIEDLLQTLSGDSTRKSWQTSNVSFSLLELISYLRLHRYLLVLDGWDEILKAGEICGIYLKKYCAYGNLIRCLTETPHKSCLLLTTREKSQEIAFIEGKNCPVRVMTIDSLKESTALDLLLASDLIGSQVEYYELIKKCFGNPLLLKIATQKIRDFFDCQIFLFLQHEHIVVNDIIQLGTLHIERLSSLEREILFKLIAISKPVSFSELQQNISLLVSSHKLIDVLESLLRRSILIKQFSLFTVHPIIYQCGTKTNP